MANAATAADHITLNPGQGGAVVATDFVNTLDMGYGSGVQGPAHFQVVKLSTAGPGGFALLSDASPAPAKIVSVGNSTVPNGYLAVRGNTAGDQAVPVSISGATLTVSDITILGGTLDRIVGASCDIRSVASGVEFAVKGTGSDEVVVTGNVSVSAGLSADIRSLPLPTGITCFSIGFDDTVVQGFSNYSLSSGVKVKNYFSGLEGLTPGLSGPGGGLMCVGFTGSHFTAGCSKGFLLSPGEEVFIELDNMNKIVATSVDYDGSQTYVIASILGT